MMMAPSAGSQTAVLLLSAAALLAAAAGHSEGLLGARKLSQAHDCSGVVAFSGVAARASTKVSNGTEEGLGTELGFRNLLTDKSVGWSRESGEFTCFCPGLYQFAFSGAGPGVRLSLRKKPSGAAESPSTSSWEPVVSTAVGGGAHVILLEMELGDVAAVWLLDGELSEGAGVTTSSFSGYRIAKK